MTIVSAVQRIETREETINQLAQVGLTPTIILNTPDRPNGHQATPESERLRARGFEVIVTGNPNKPWGGPNNALAFREAFLKAHGEGRGLVYCEDDLTIALDFPWFLREAVKAQAATWFYAHELHRDEDDLNERYGPELWARIKRHAKDRRPFPRGLHPIRKARRLNSGQCFYLPHRALDALPLAELDKQSSPVDRWTQHRLEKAGVHMFIALPHPVQHRYVRVGRDASKREKRSISFYLREGVSM